MDRALPQAASCPSCPAHLAGCLQRLISDDAPLFDNRAEKGSIVDLGGRSGGVPCSRSGALAHDAGYTTPSSRTRARIAADDSGLHQGTGAEPSDPVASTAGQDVTISIELAPRDKSCACSAENTADRDEQAVASIADIG